MKIHLEVQNPCTPLHFQKPSTDPPVSFTDRFWPPVLMFDTYEVQPGVAINFY